jgi:hypothetical protein
VLAENLSLHLRYRHAKSESTRWFEGISLPYMPKHQGTLGLMWLPAPRWALQAQAIYRSWRYRDVLNPDPLEAGWDATVLSSWQSYTKAWQLDAYLGSLFNDDQPTRAGVAISFRF